jgi:DedD protein
MEQNNQQDTRVKEKNVYLLHLDGPRILILSAIIIGMLSLAFLVGMKIMGEGKTEDNIAHNDSIADQRGVPPVDELDPAKTPLPDLQGSQTITPQTAVQDSIMPQPSTQVLNSTKKTEPDLLSPISAQEVISSSKPVSKDEGKSAKTVKASSKKQIQKKSKSSKSETDDVVEVSSVKQKNEKKTQHGFFVQCASLDRIEKAKNEVQKLKDMEYDAFFDKKELKGKDFYRVRVGPIATKDKAIQILEEIQQNPRYEDSFVVHE